MTTNELAAVRIRTWVLLAMDACDKHGLAPIANIRLHQLVFLSGCLADLFSTTPPFKRILKYHRGPFYPDVQWQLDRLTAMGLVDIPRSILRTDSSGVWFDGDYRINKSGIDCAQACKRTPVGEDAARYMDELVFAFVRLSEDRLDQIALHDLNYNMSGSANGVLISFEDRSSNLAIRKTDEFGRLAPAALRGRVRERLHLYMRYLERLEGVRE